MKKLTTILTALFLPAILFAQYTINDINDLSASHLIRILNNENDDTYTGSPYDNDEFIEGTLVTIGKQKYQDIPLRLNIYKNTIEFKRNDEILELDNPELFDYITIGETKVKYIPYSIIKKINKGYFKIIEEGEANLLVKPKVIFKEATKPEAYQEAVPASYNRGKDEIYIQVGESQAQLVKNKKSLIEILSEKGELISAFIKDRKIKANDIDDVRSLIKYYNSN